MKKPIHISTFQIGTPRKRGEGLRIGTIRYLPHGIRKKDYAKLDLFDVWLPILAPSRELLRWLKEREDTAHNLKKFFEKYQRELTKTDARQVIKTLVELSRNTRISVGCYCADESCCHRHILIKILKAASK